MYLVFKALAIKSVVLLQLMIFIMLYIYVKIQKLIILSNLCVIHVKWHN